MLMCKVVEKKDYVLYFGRFSEEKGINTLVETCNLLPDIQFVFAGSGPLEDKINQLKNVKNVGFQTGEALDTLIREAKFSICPSEVSLIFDHTVGGDCDPSYGHFGKAGLPWEE